MSHLTRLPLPLCRAENASLSDGFIPSVQINLSAPRAPARTPQTPVPWPPPTRNAPKCLGRHPAWFRDCAKFLKKDPITIETPIVSVKNVDEEQNRKTFVSAGQVTRFFTKTLFNLFPFEKQRVQTALEYSAHDCLNRNVKISHSANKIHLTFS